MRRFLFFRICAVGSRLFLGLIFFTGGMSKLMPFPGVMGPVWLEAELEPYGLGLYARFIAWSEAVIGIVLVSQRFATLGAIMLVPLVLNILMVTVSMNWRGTPYVVAFFLFVNLCLLAYEYDRWRPIVADARVTTPRLSWGLGPDTLCLAGIALNLAGPAVYAVNGVSGYGSVLVGLAMMLGAGVWQWRRSPRKGRGGIRTHG